MGTSTIFHIGEDPFTPTELSAEVSKKIKADKIGPIAEAVVTIPANFSNEARDATLEACRLADLEVKFVINGRQQPLCTTRMRQTEIYQVLMRSLIWAAELSMFL